MCQSRTSGAGRCGNPRLAVTKRVIIYRGSQFSEATQTGNLTIKMGNYMKNLATFIACISILLMLACRSEPPKLTRVQVNPQNAQVGGPGAHLAFTAVGMFENRQSRNLTSADGVAWSTSDGSIASINSASGQATCNTPGTVAITVRVPAGVTLSPNSEAHHTSDDVTGMANLLCLGPPPQWMTRNELAHDRCRKKR